MIRRVLGFLSAVALSAAAGAQICGPGDTYLKNDGLPDNPTSSQVYVNQLACTQAGPGIGCVFDVSAPGIVTKVDAASVGYYGVNGFTGGTAIVGLRMYDGITWTSGVANLGPLVLNTGYTITLTSTGINTVNLASQNVFVQSGKLVVTWTVFFQNDPWGDCSTGLWANFATDAAQGGTVCDPLVTPVGRNLFTSFVGTPWQDAATNGYCPAYYAGNWVMRVCVPAEAGTPFCLPGQAGVVACPCGNAPGASGRGCENSAATGGARLMAFGNPHVGFPLDTLMLESGGMLPTALCIFLQGDAQLAAGVAFGDGVRCSGGFLKRIGLKAASGGIAIYPGPGDPPVSLQSAALGDPLAPGATRAYQTYYRDPASFACPSPATFNVTQGMLVTWQ